jgi:hypothetical protein
MQRRRSVSDKFEENVTSEEVKLQAEIAKLEARLTILGKHGPKMTRLGKNIRQPDTGLSVSKSASSPRLHPPKQGTRI